MMNSANRLPKLLLLACCVVLAAAMLGACSSQPQADVTIGNNDKQAVSMVFDNQTEHDIIAISVKAAADDPSSFEELAALDQAWSVSKKARICLPKEIVEGSLVSDDPTGSGIDIMLTFSDGAARTLHCVSFSEAASAKVFIDSEDDVAYLSYIDSNKQEVSTLDEERDRKASMEVDLDQGHEDAYYPYDYGYASAGGANQYVEGCLDDDVAFR